MEQNFFREPNTFVGHVELNVEDLTRSVQFYKETIGFQLVEQTDTKAVLSADGETALLTLFQPENAVPKVRNTTGLYHFALLLPNRLELAKILKHFIEINYPLGSSDHLVSEALYLNDPDGNGIEIYTDRPASEWSWSNGEVKMTVDPLDARGILAELKDEKWSGLPKETVMGHIHLHVSDLQEAERFYREGLGFEVVCRYGDQALFISTGKYHHHIALNTWAGAGAPRPPKNSAGLRSFSLVLPTEAARKEAVKQLQQLGYSTQLENDVIVANDPAGNNIQLTVKNNH